MNFRNAHTHVIRMLCVLVCALGMAVPVTAALPATARAASCLSQAANGDWHIAYGCNSVLIPASHACKQTGEISDSHGVTTTDECADLAVTNVSGATQIWGVGEFYCQGAFTQCQQMQVSVWVDVYRISDGLDTWSPYRIYTCSGGGCPSGGRAMVSTAHITTSRGVCYTSGAVDPIDGSNALGSVAPQIIWVDGHAFHAAVQTSSAPLVICFD